MGEDFLKKFKPPKDEELTPEKRAEILAITDPVIWCEATLRDPENPIQYLSFRDCQRSVMEHNPYVIVNEKSERVMRNRIKVLRMGRRLGKTVVLAAEALHKAATNANFKILYVAPFESQCTVFFGMIEKMLTNTVLKPTSFRKKPYYLQFANGSTITGHTANVRASNKGSSIRGAEGDHIIIDEMDYGIDDVIEEVIIPIYNGNNIATITGASTPTGRRGVFYDWCVNGKKDGIREFYYTSFHNPKYNSEADTFNKRHMTKSRYQHEILAEFGEEMEGVFKNKDLDSCLSDYHYNTLKRNPENMYIMGVDWNETFGVCIVIIERSKKSGKYRVFRHVIIENQELTQLAGVSKIIDIHTKECPCDFIYVDHGFGATQIELLKKYGMDHPETRFCEIVKDIDYGGKIIMKDPVTKKDVERPAKPFLVHNTQLVVESNGLFMPEAEDTELGIAGQMRNFRVSKFSATGNPIYEGKLHGQDNDHSLNGLFLALMGYTLELQQVLPDPVVVAVKQVNDFRLPEVPARETMPSDGEMKFQSLLRTYGPNFRKRVDISALDVGYTKNKKPVLLPRMVTRSRLPKRRSF